MLRPSDVSIATEALSEDERVEELFEHLANKGFRKVGKLYYGGYAIVLEGGNHQMIRVVPKGRERERVNAPYMVQPLTTIDDFNGYHIEILPRVHTARDILNSVVDLGPQYGFVQNKSEESTSRYKERVEGELYKEMMDFRDYLEVAHQMNFTDPWLTNMAMFMTEQGPVMKILDPGAVVPLSRKQIMNNIDRNRSLNECRNPKYHDQQSYDKLLETAEADHLEALGHVRGHTVGVVSDEDLEKLRAIKADGYNADDTLYSRAISEQKYVDEMGQLIREAIRDTNTDLAAINAEIKRNGLCGFTKRVLDEKISTGADISKGS